MTTLLEEILNAVDEYGRVRMHLEEEHTDALRKAIELSKKVAKLLEGMEDGAVDAILLAEVKELLQ